MRSSGSRGAVTASAPAPAELVVEVARAPAGRRRARPAGRRRPGRRRPRRHRAAGGRAVARCSPGRSSAPAGRRGGVDVGDRARGRWSPAAASTTAVAGSPGSAPAATSRSCSTATSPGVRTQRAGGAGRVVLAHGAGDVDVHVVAPRQLSGRTTEGRPPRQPAKTSATFGRLHRAKAAVVTRRPVGGGGRQLGDQPAAGGVAGPRAAGDQHGRASGCRWGRVTASSAGRRPTGDGWCR
jgi:hypothetical protein